MDRSIPNEHLKSGVAKPAPAAGLRRGGSVTLPAGATQEDIDNALRQPAAEQETQ
jgi:hypothetical protein